MDERVMQFRVGVMVCGHAADHRHPGGDVRQAAQARPGHTTRCRSSSIRPPGVTDGTPVRKSGILIGPVRKVEFAKDRAGRQDTKVLVTADIDADKKIYEDEICQLQSNLLGDAVLEFVRAPRRDARTDPIPEGAMIEGVYRSDPATIHGRHAGRTAKFDPLGDRDGRSTARGRQGADRSRSNTSTASSKRTATRSRRPSGRPNQRSNPWAMWPKTRTGCSAIPRASGSSRSRFAGCRRSSKTRSGRFKDWSAA